MSTIDRGLHYPSALPIYTLNTTRLRVLTGVSLLSNARLGSIGCSQRLIMTLAYMSYKKSSCLYLNNPHILATR